MDSLLYILRKTIINRIKSLRKHPGQIAYLIFILLMIGLMIFSSIMSKKESVHSYSDPSILLVISTAVIIGFLYLILLTSLENGNTMFRLPDINLVFTSPTHPRKILIYGFIKQLGVSLAAMMFLFFQLPQIYSRFEVKGYAALIIIISALLLFFLPTVLSMILYNLHVSKNIDKTLIKRGIHSLFFLLTAPSIYYIFQAKNIWTGIKNYTLSSLFDYLPIISWFRYIIMTSIHGFDLKALIFLLLIIAVILICIYALQAMDLDYYEDCILYAERFEEIKKVKSGKMSARELRGNKKTLFNKVKKVTVNYKGKGAKAIFYRHLLEYKKTGFIFLDYSSLIIAVASIVFGYFLPVPNPLPIAFFSIYILFFTSMQGKWQQELTKPYIFLIPDSSIKKIFYSTLCILIKNSIDSLIIFLTLGFIKHFNILDTVLSIALYISFSAIFIYIDVLKYKLIGDFFGAFGKVFIYMVFTIAALLPATIILGVLVLIFKIQNAVLFTYIVFIPYNILFSLLTLYLSKGLFENCENTSI